MEVYILDSLYRRVGVVDVFESLVWTERFADIGDIKLTVGSTLENLNRFVAGVNLSIVESMRVMTVETVEDTTDDEGRKILKVSGRSLEKILENRLARGDLDDLVAVPKWIITGLPVDIAEQIFHDICITGVLDSGDIINCLESDDIFPVDNIPEPADSITYEMDMMSVYQAIKTLADEFNFGFRLCLDEATYTLYWDIYMGSDRTASQTDLPAVIFSPQLDNLKNTTQLKSMKLYRNVAYVFSPAGYEIVYPLDVDPLIEGFERQVLFIKADDIEAGDPDASDKMIRRGQEELAKARPIVALDGELSQTNQYIYGVHYNLGDMVELRNDAGASSRMQVSEQIFVSDGEGARAYPTLVINQFITPGSWDAMPPTTEWYDMTTEEWDDMPE